MEIPMQSKDYYLNQVRQMVPQFRELSDEQIMDMIPQHLQAILNEMETAQAGAADQANIEKMSAAACGLKGEQLLDSGRWQDAEPWLVAALDKAEKSGDTMNQSLAVRLLGRLCLSRGEYPQAMELSQQALRLAEGLAAPQLQAGIYIQIGSIHRDQGQYMQAIEHYKKSLEFIESGNDLELAVVLE